MLSAALLLVCTVISAQPRLRAPEMYIGAQGGVVASTVLFSPTVNNMSDPFTNGVTLGGNAGLLFRYAGHKVCGLQVELNYMHRGWREHTDTATYQRHLHYLELPFLMHLYFGKRAVRGFVNLGPQIGVCLADSAIGPRISGTSATQYASIHSRFDWGLAGGLGMYVRTRNAGVYQLELRANYSLGSIYGTSPTDHFTQANPLDVSLNLGWLWPLNKPKQVKFEN